MKKINLTSILIILLIVSNLYLLLRKGTPSEPVVEACDNYRNSKSKASGSDFGSRFYDNYAFVILPNENKFINLNAIVQDTTFHKITVKSLLPKRKEALLFCYSYSDCEGCVDLVLRSLDEDRSIKSVVITDSFDDADFKLKTKHQEFNQPIYSLVDSKLNLPLEGKTLPFLAIVDSLGKTSHFFTPHKDYPEQFKSYLQFVKNYLK